MKNIWAKYYCDPYVQLTNFAINCVSSCYQLEKQKRKRSFNSLNPLISFQILVL